MIPNLSSCSLVMLRSKLLVLAAFYAGSDGSDNRQFSFSSQDGSYLAEFLLEKGYEVSDSVSRSRLVGSLGHSGLLLPLLPSSCVCFPLEL